MSATNKHIPGKRLKQWHRNASSDTASQPLKEFARGMLAIEKTLGLSTKGVKHADTVQQWAGGKVAP